MRLLTVNAGSTSLKLTTIDGGVDRWQGADLDAALGLPPPDAVAHRIVHGGRRTSAALVDDELLAELVELTPLAPLHQPPATDAIRRCRAAWPDIPQVACFDTAFHSTIPEAARASALPAPWRDAVRGSGFHGLSHAWSARRVAELAPTARRVVVAHLGGGQSLCAVLDGRSVHTTLGFSTIGGLVMGTRSGAVDPGAVLWIAERHGGDVAAMFERESGLLGLCGDRDMRAVRQRADGGDPAARFALEVWCHHAVTHLGACIAVLGGIDALVFTGGIGEHDHAARQAVTGRCGWLGLGTVDHHDTDPGSGGDLELTAPGSGVRTFVVAAREDLQMWTETEALLGR